MPSTPITSPVPDSNAPSANRIRRVFWVLISLGVLVYLSFRVTWLDKFMVHVDDFVPMAELLRLHANPWLWSDIVYLSGRYTYPPGQFFISFPLASLSTDFETMLLLYRLPSLIFWLSGLGLFYYLIRTIWPNSSRVVAVIPVFLGLISWRGFVESSQGYNYASTTLMVSVASWLLVTPQGRNWIVRKPLTAFSGGLLLGAFTWLTYQTVFVAFAGLGALFVSHLINRNFRALRLTLLSGLGFSVPFAAVYWLCLRHVLIFASGTPAWAAGGLPGPTLADKFTFFFSAWFNVFQNNLTFAPWGFASSCIAAAGSILGLTGIILALRNPSTRRIYAPLLLFLLAMVIVFTVGAYLRLFPLGASRHSFVLQIPLLLTTALGLAELRVGIRTAAITLITLTCIWLATLPKLTEGTRNRVDYGLIERTFAQWPDTRISDLPGGFSWEITYLARKDMTRLERIRWYLQFPHTKDLAAWLMESPHALMVSHRGPMGSITRDELMSAGAKTITPLAEITPGLGTELSGQLNGGNGFYLYMIER